MTNIARGQTDECLGEAQAQQDEAALAAAVRDLGLTDYESASWSSVSVDGGQATMQGTITTRAGEGLPLEMVLIKVAEEWKVFSLSGRQAGAAVQRPGEDAPTALPATVPAAEERAALATTSLLALNRSIVEADFSSFYGGVSQLWQGQTTAEELAVASQAFVDREIDISAIEALEPVFDPEPTIEANGVLTLAGYYQTTPLRVVFSLRFVSESGAWRLIGTKLDLLE